MITAFFLLNLVTISQACYAMLCYEHSMTGFQPILKLFLHIVTMDEFLIFLNVTYPT